MNSIKKTLIIYMSLALILCGMAGVSYAITATDADTYITRSKYATDMAYLQLQLDEAESSLVGKMNKYRATEVKFVTYDTPNKYNTATGGDYSGGYHNGGNYYPRKRYESGGWQYQWGSGGVGNQKTGTYKDIRVCRIWNGNFYITNSMGFSDDAATNAVFYYPCAMFSVPAENLPGWYFTFMHYYTDNRAMYYVSLVKLDPNVSYGSNADQQAIVNKDIQIRFRKNMFVYSANNTTAWPVNRATTTENVTYYNNRQYFSGLTRTYISGISTSSKSVVSNAWTDPKTGDYMVTLRGIQPCCPYFGYQSFYLAGNYVSRLIVADNVEYVQYATLYYEYHDVNGGFPDSRNIGNGLAADQNWEYEFVDCLNGIQYWHAFRKPSKTQLGPSGLPMPFGIHYSLPIVY